LFWRYGGAGGRIGRSSENEEFPRIHCGDSGEARRQFDRDKEVIRPAAVI